MDGSSFVFPNDPHVAWSIMIVLYPYITGLGGRGICGFIAVSRLPPGSPPPSRSPGAGHRIVLLCICDGSAAVASASSGTSVQHYDHSQCHIGDVRIWHHLQPVHAAADCRSVAGLSRGYCGTGANRRAGLSGLLYRIAVVRRSGRSPKNHEPPMHG